MILGYFPAFSNYLKLYRNVSAVGIPNRKTTFQETKGRCENSPEGLLRIRVVMNCNPQRLTNLLLLCSYSMDHFQDTLRYPRTITLSRGFMRNLMTFASWLKSRYGAIFQSHWSVIRKWSIEMSYSGMVIRFSFEGIQRLIDVKKIKFVVTK